mgnify:CR=1 FL=1
MGGLARVHSRRRRWLGWGGCALRICFHPSTPSSATIASASATRSAIILEELSDTYCSFQVRVRADGRLAVKLVVVG